MRNEETEIRIEAMRRLDVVARALGPDNTVDELVPFLIGETPPCLRARLSLSAPRDPMRRLSAGRFGLGLPAPGGPEGN